mmetsp:Transcript_18501/g.51463  ORF Transcript_18501/g.51463 Transcript_18501/m.51463 type:complete len:232 (-) Transcript_18501:1406-2101(-)
MYTRPLQKRASPLSGNMFTAVCASILASSRRPNRRLADALLTRTLAEKSTSRNDGSASNAMEKCPTALAKSPRSKRFFPSTHCASANLSAVSSDATADDPSVCGAPLCRPNGGSTKSAASRNNSWAFSRCPSRNELLPCQARKSTSWGVASKAACVSLFASLPHCCREAKGCSDLSGCGNKSNFTLVRRNLLPKGDPSCNPESLDVSSRSNLSEASTAAKLCSRSRGFSSV